MKQNMKQNMKLQKGGDGYVVNVNEIIGGKPAFSRYSYNYAPIFDGALLNNQSGGFSDNSGDSCDTCNNCGRCTLLNSMTGGAKGGCGCTGSNTTTNNPPIFNLINQAGGAKPKKNITQFYAINQLAHILEPLDVKSLLDLNLELFLNNLHKNKPLKAVQLGGDYGSLQEIIAPLGKQNLLVLASLLLLHHFAVENTDYFKKKSTSTKFKKISLLKGGCMNQLTSILAPLGVNQLGASVILLLLQQAFTKNKSLKSEKSSTQMGGSPLIELIAPLGKNAFIATGLLVVLEKLMSDKKIKNDIKTKKIGGNKNFNGLFNLIAPLTFNTFAKKDFLDKYVKYQKENKNK